MKNNLQFLMIIGLMGLVTVFSSCNKAQYYKITEEEEEAWSIYDKDQTFKFISTQGDLRIYNTGGKFKAYFRNGNVYEEYLYTTVFLDGDSSDYYSKGPKGLFIDKTAEGLSVKISLPHFYDNVQINNLAPSLQTVNGKNYPDVYVVAANQLYLDSINYIDTIYYSQSFGFLKYVDMYGEIYTKTQ